MQSFDVSLRRLHATALAFGLGAASAFGAPLYHVTDLGTVQTPLDTAVAAMNDSGQVAGSVLIDDALACVLFDHGTVTQLGAPGGPGCFARGLSDSGVVVGSELARDGSGTLHGFSWSRGNMVDLQADPNYPDSEAVGIDGHGEIVGNSFDMLQEEAFYDHRGTLRLVGVPPGALQVAAQAVNRGGDVAGNALFISGHAHAFLFSRGEALDLGTLGGLSNGDSAGLAINEKRQVAGWSSGPGFRRHALLASAGRLIDLGVLPAGDPYASSEATGIDARGRVVGTSDDGAGNTVAFFYDGRKMRDLGKLLDDEGRQAWQLVSAHSINRRGEISGMALSLADGSSHVFLASPVK